MRSALAASSTAALLLLGSCDDAACRSSYSVEVCTDADFPTGCSSPNWYETVPYLDSSGSMPFMVAIVRLPLGVDADDDILEVVRPGTTERVAVPRTVHRGVQPDLGLNGCMRRDVVSYDLSVLEPGIWTVVHRTARGPEGLELRGPERVMRFDGELAVFFDIELR